MLLTMAELTTMITMWALKKVWGGAVYMVWGTPISPEQAEIKELRDSMNEIKELERERLQLEKEKRFDAMTQARHEKREKEIHNIHDSFRASYMEDPMSQSCPNLKIRNPELTYLAMASKNVKSLK